MFAENKLLEETLYTDEALVRTIFEPLVHFEGHVPFSALYGMHASVVIPVLLT
jgi:hypothetical protein